MTTGALFFQPKIPEILVVHQMERAISVFPTKIFGTSFGLIISGSVRPKCPFPFDKIVLPCTVLLYPAYKNNNQTRWIGSRL